MSNSQRDELLLLAFRIVRTIPDKNRHSLYCIGEGLINEHLDMDYTTTWLTLKALDSDLS